MVYALITQAFSFHLGSDWIIEFELQNRIVIGIPALMELKIRTGLLFHCLDGIKLDYGSEIFDSIHNELYLTN